MQKFWQLIGVMVISIWSAVTVAEVNLVYRPPQLGAPETRVGSGTRGGSITLIQLAVLAPKHTALTATDQPILYWYVSTAAPQLVEVTVIREGVEEPLVEKQFSIPATRGVQAIRLSDYGVALKKDQEYRWTVALIADGQQRSTDRLTSATIRFQPSPVSMVSLEQKAGAGYWYDIVSQLIESRSPKLKDLLQQGEVAITGM